MLKKIGIIFVIVGVAGFGAIFGISEFSGKKVGNFNLLKTTDDVPSIPDFLRMKGKSGSYYFGPIQLSSDMNPLSMKLSVTKGGQVRGDGWVMSYNVRLVGIDGRESFRKSGTLRSKKKKKKEGALSSITSAVVGEKINARLGHFTVSETGDYYIAADVRDTSYSDTVNTQVNLVIRRNVIPINVTGFAASAGILIIGMIFLYVGKRKSKRS